MEGLLYQSCTVYKKIAPTKTDGTPNHTESAVASGVACRLDTLISQYLRTTHRDMPASEVEEYHGTLYVMPNELIDDTCYVVISGDTRQWHVMFINKQAGYGDMHHWEMDVRSVAHR
jgi:hypothetical protein